MNSEELLQHLLKNVSEEKRRILMEKINGTEQAQENEEIADEPIETFSTNKNKNKEEYDSDNSDEDNKEEYDSDNDDNIERSNIKNKDMEHRSFDTLLQQIGEKGGEILSQEERDFFFQKSDNPNVRIEAVEKEPKIFEEVMLAPIFLDIKKLLYLNMAFLVILIFILTFSVYLQSINQDLQNNTLSSMRNMENRYNADTERLWEFFALDPEVRKNELQLRINSTLATKNEKRACYFLLATMSFEEQDFSKGREYMLKGVQLSNEKK